MFSLRSAAQALQMIVALCCAACASSPQQPISNRIEPAAIIVRNHTATNYASATLIATSNTVAAKGRLFGQLAPIPAGIDQFYGRPTVPRPLPDDVELVLADNRGVTLRRTFRLDTLLTANTQNSGSVLSVKRHALVFELRHNGAIAVYLELLP